MSPPIFTPDGSEVSEIVLPDGSTASQVIGPDGNVVFEAGPDIPDSGVARLTFDDADTSGSTALDVWNGNDGTINAGVTTGVTGANQTYTTNEAYSFAEGNSGVTLPFSHPSGDGNWSIAFWVNLDTVHFDTMLGNESGKTGIHFRTNAGNNNWAWVVRDSSGSQFFVSEVPTTGSWVFIVGVRNSSSFEFYKNDATLVGSDSNSSVASNVSPLNFRVGCAGDGGGPAPADIDDPRWYSKSLSATEISNLYNTGSISG